ncbi:unnamed protein product, partial [marine sediment metagenome]
LPMFVLNTDKDIRPEMLMMPRIATTGINVWM